jgi:arylformamidase
MNRQSWPWNPLSFEASYLDSQYNNRARVSDVSQRYLQPWQESSEQYRRECSPVTERYLSMTPSQKLEGWSDNGCSLDVFAPKAKHWPVIVFIHGGYWRSLDKSDFSFVAKGFNAKGLGVVVTNYDLCPTVTMDSIALQQAQALKWVAFNIAQLGGDPTRIHVVGHSAGGHLAAMLATCDWTKVDKNLPENLVKSATSLSGLFELSTLQKTPTLQSDLRLTDEQVVNCSPAYFAPPSCPIYAFCGADESDEFLRHNALFEAAWGPVVERREALLGLNHFSVLDAWADPMHRLNLFSTSQILSG